MGEYVGSMQLTTTVVEPLQLQIGWLALPQHHGKGFMTEAVKRVLELAFASTGAHRIVAEIIGGNDASVRLAERVGFRKEGHLVRSAFIKGEWRDEMVYAILAAEGVPDRELPASGDSVDPTR
jgi:RimJ/RimL family protein N-acetyltransferase